jgi:hypothetical protein
MQHYSIQQGDRYWQCGMWVGSIYKATKYPSEDEALGVIAMRGLHNGIVVPNHEEWRDLRNGENMSKTSTQGATNGIL